MGNHYVGRAMGRMAEMALKMRTNQTALELLDEICEPYRGADAEFETDKGNSHYTEPDEALGILIAEAFDPTGEWAERQRKARLTGDDDKIEEFYENWGYDGPERQFSARYDFC